MTEKRSDEETWARLADAATPGPWKVDRASEAEKFYGDVSFDVFALADGMTVAEGGPTEDGGPHVGACNEADAEFIAASREAVPSLLAALAASRADNEQQWERVKRALHRISNASVKAVMDEHVTVDYVNGLEAAYAIVRAALAEPLGSTPEQEQAK